MAINVIDYGSIISDDAVGARILGHINRELGRNEQPVVVDFDNVLSITTFNAKQIFGELYFNLGADMFFKRIHFKNASENIVTIIKMGIRDRMIAVPA